MVKADKKKLSRLLDYWIEHNKEHGDEFREWAEQTESFTGIAIRDHLLRAVQQMDEVNEFLLMALDKLEEQEW